MSAGDGRTTELRIRISRRGGGSAIRHYGLIAGTVRALNIERARQLLAAPERARPEARSTTRNRKVNGFVRALEIR